MSSGIGRAFDPLGNLAAKHLKVICFVNIWQFPCQFAETIDAA